MDALFHRTRSPPPGAVARRIETLFVDVRRWLLGDEALQAPREDRDEGNLNNSDEVLLRPLEDDVQPPIAATPSK